MAQQAPESFEQWINNNVAGSFADQEEATSRMKLAAERCHFIGGRAVCPPLQVGCELMLSVIWINLDKTYPTRKTKGGEGEGDSAPTGGDDEVRGIGKANLMQIAAAAGVEWKTETRVDDGRDPRYCEFSVEGRYKDLDGTWRKISGRRDTDLRDGSDQTNGKTEKEIAQLRANIVRSTETKAKLRAIREAFGLDQGMKVRELRKPFVVARVVFTGKAKDPVVARMYALAIMQQHLPAATSALFGSGSDKVAGLLSQQVSHTPDGEVIDVPHESRPVERHAPPPPPPPASSPARANGGASGSSSRGSISGEWSPRFGRNQGVPVSQIPDGDLAWYEEAFTKSLNDPAKAQFRDDNERSLAAVRGEIARRKAPTAGSAPANGAGRRPQAEDADRGADPNNY